MIEKFKKFRREFGEKNPKEKWLFMFHIANKVKLAIGIRLLSDLKFTWFTPLCGLCGVDLFLSTFYTIIYYFKKDKFLVGLEATCLWGPATASLIMYWKTVGPDKWKANHLTMFSGKNIYPNNNENTKFNRLCHRRVHDLIKNTFIIIPVILFAYGMILIGPSYAYLCKGLLVTPLATKLPYTDEESERTFFINMAHQSVIGLVAVLGNIAIEIMASMINNTLEIMPDIICLNIDELSEQLRKENYRMSLNSKQKLRHVLVQIRDFGLYLDTMIEVYYAKMLVAPLIFGYTITISIISQLVLDFPAGYGSAVSCYFQLLIMCYMGNNVKNSHTKINNALYEMKWHYLDTPGQKQIARMILRAQNGTVLTIGPFDELNYETATILTKKIYTILTFLVKILMK